MPIEIECPSGLKGKVRKLTGKDGRYLSDREVQRQGTIVEYILQNCWIETSDPGIYKDHVTASGPNWKKVLQGDRTYALLQIRVATHGEIYPFKAQCSNTACVRRRFEWEIDLDDLPVRALPDESKKRLMEGTNRFEIRVPGTEEMRMLSEEERAAIVVPGGRKPKRIVVPDTGTKMFFSLPTGEDEARALKEMRERKKRPKSQRAEENEMVDAIRLRVLEIEGVEKGRRDEGLTEYLEGLGLDDLANMLDRFDEFDCGVETTIEIECPECETIQEVELPFDRNFFFPRKERTIST